MPIITHLANTKKFKMDIGTQKKLSPLLGRLGGLKKGLVSSVESTYDFLCDYNSLVKEISSLLDTDYSSFLAREEAVVGQGPVRRGINRHKIIKEKLYQFVSTMEQIHTLEDNVAPVGKLYTSISDVELKNRCEDILSANDNFDRVINQATLVLENRIRAKANLENSDRGVALVNKALNSDIERSILIVSEDPTEHTGFCDICRGIMTAYRNPTHHFLTEYSREDALKVCVFIDHLLLLIDNSQLKDG